MPIIDKNPTADSYTQLQIKKPCLTLNSEMHINIREQELATCKRIGYKFYCEEFLLLDINLSTAVKVQYTLI